MGDEMRAAMDERWEGMTKVGTRRRADVHSVDGKGFVKAWRMSGIAGAEAKGLEVRKGPLGPIFKDSSCLI
jgi:hypothetical protein